MDALKRRVDRELEGGEEEKGGRGGEGSRRRRCQDVLRVRDEPNARQGNAVRGAMTRNDEVAMALRSQRPSGQMRPPLPDVRPVAK